MAETRPFTHVCETLEARTGLGRLEVRGTVRLALKKAGLDAASVTLREMAVLVDKVLPAELRARGVDAPETVCSELRSSLSSLPQDRAARETPESVFDRLAGAPSRS